MKIYLFRDHTGLLMDDGAAEVTVECGYRDDPAPKIGSLLVNGQEFLKSRDYGGRELKAEYVTADGIRFSIGSVRQARRGALTSVIDTADMLVRLIVRVEKDEAELERMSGELRALKARRDYDDFGGIFCEEE